MNKREFLQSLGVMAVGITLTGTGFSSCSGGNKNAEIRWPKFWIWIHEKSKWSDEEVSAAFARLNEFGIQGVCTGGSVGYLKRIAPIAKKHHIELHNWMWTLNHPGDETARQHPDWFMVSREGKSCFDNPPYVDYYRWLCPSKEEVCQYVEDLMVERAEIEGLAGVHFDYVRYPDVILPVALQPTYNIVQDKEYPPYDFCYCDTCKIKFKKEYNIDLDALEDPAASPEWKKFRYDRVTNLVNRIAEKIRERGKLVTAAVFPYPELARTICRQSWNEWKLDAFFPMIYHNFYNEGVEWVGKATKTGITDLKAQGDSKLFTGLYLPAFNDNEELEAAINIAMENGAAGVAIFDFDGLTEEQLNIINNNSNTQTTKL